MRSARDHTHTHSCLGIWEYNNRDEDDDDVNVQNCIQSSRNPSPVVSVPISTDSKHEALYLASRLSLPDTHTLFGEGNCSCQK